MVTLIGSALPQLNLPGFSFEEMFGKGYKSLLSHEREQVTRAIGVAGLLLLHSEGRIPCRV